MALMVGLGMVSFSVICSGSISIAYTVDYFKEIRGESMITIIFICSTVGFAFGYAINPWIDNLGLRDCFISVSMIALGCNFTFLAIVACGKRLRKLSARKYWQWVAADRGIWAE